MNRRRFLQQAGIWVPSAIAFPAIVRAQFNPFANPARTGPMTRRAAEAPPSCSTEKDTDHPAYSFYAAFTDAAHSWYGFNFTAGSSYTMCKLGAFLAKGGTPAGLMTAYLYTDTGGSGPGTAIGTQSDTVSVAVLDTAYAEIAFENMSCSVTNATAYWVVIHHDTPHGTNQVRWQNNSGTLAFKGYISSDGSTWTLFGNYLHAWWSTYA